MNGQKIQVLRLVDSGAALYGSVVMLLRVGGIYHVLVVGVFFPFNFFLLLPFI